MIFSDLIPTYRVPSPASRASNQTREILAVKEHCDGA